MEQVTVVGTPAPPPIVTAALEQAKARLANAAPKSPKPKPAAKSESPPQLTQRGPGEEPAHSQEAGEHPKLLPTRKALSRGKPDGKGFVHASGRGVLPTAVGPDSVERVLAWLSGFLRFAEAQGIRFHRKEEGAVLIIEEEEIPFRIEEKSERTPHTPTAKQLAEKAKWGHIYSPTWTPWPKYDHTPSGKLSLVIEGYGAPGLRSTFGETATRTLDAMSGDFLAACIARAALIKENRRKAEAAKREADAAQRRRERLKSFQQREERREKFVGLIADKLEERARLCAVLQHVERPQADEPERLDAIAAWIRRRLAEIDALLSPTFLDISARSANIEFDEARALARPAEPSWYYPRAVELQLWRLDEAAGNAHSQDPYEWAKGQRLIPDVEREGVASDDKHDDEPDADR